MDKPFPDSARIVVIGGGVIGTSIAFHLARAGERDVVLLEKSKLTEGATWHAAGLVGQFRSQQNLTSLMNDSVKLFDTLGQETGQEIGWRKVGSLRTAANPDRWKELLKSHSAARAIGFEMNLLTPSEAADIYPLINTDDLVGAAFIPEDGHIDPYSLTQAYARGIRINGGQVIEGVMVKELLREGNRITQVVTDHGNIAVETVVNAAGLWARQVGWMAGVEIPAGVVEHQYLVTEKSDQIPDGIPAFRDPDGGYYAKPEPGALAIGGWEKSTATVNPKEGFPWQCERHLFDSNMDRLEEIFTPDYNPCQAGLQFLIDWNKGEFLGSQALARIRQEGVRQKLACLALDEPLPVFGGEAILVQGEAISQTTSGNFGYSTGKSLVLGYLPVEIQGESDFEIEAFCRRSRATIIKGAAYDPKRTKILC